MIRVYRGRLRDRILAGFAGFGIRHSRFPLALAAQECSWNISLVARSCGWESEPGTDAGNAGNTMYLDGSSGRFELPNCCGTGYACVSLDTYGLR